MARVGQYRRYTLEYVLIAAVMLISILGFWDIYFSTSGGAQPKASA